MTDPRTADPRVVTGSSKARLWWKRRTVFAPRMVIRRQLSWPARIFLGALVLAMVSAVAMGSHALGRGLILPVDHQVEKIAIRLEQPVVIASGTAQSQISIERSERQQLARQIKTLETENGKLKEDLAFFEGLLPSTTAASGISIRQLKADPVGPSQVRYRLLVMQGGKADQDFRGTVQLAVTVLQEGKNAIIVFPGGARQDPADAEKFQLAFKRYQRIEGVLTLPSGTRMQSIQARILENGRLRAQETIILKGVA